MRKISRAEEQYNEVNFRTAGFRDPIENVTTQPFDASKDPKSHVKVIGPHGIDVTDANGDPLLDPATGYPVQTFNSDPRKASKTCGTNCQSCGGTGFSKAHSREGEKGFASPCPCSSSGYKCEGCKGK